MKKAVSTIAARADDRFAGLSPSGLNAQEKQSVVALATQVLAPKFRTGCVLRSPEETSTFLHLRLAELKNEVFGCIFLNTRHRIITVSELFQGTIDGASVHPRVVVQKALEMNAGAIILYHNHPSSVAEPSHADEMITRRLKEALALIDVRILDHFVVSAGETVSFAQRGLI